MKTARERMPLGLCSNLGPPIPREQLLLRYVEPVYNCHYFKSTCTLHFQRNDLSSKLCSDGCEGYRQRDQLEPIPNPPILVNVEQMAEHAHAQQIAAISGGGCCG